MIDLDAQLVSARHVVQTFDAALGRLDDTDLIAQPRSPSWEPRVDTSDEGSPALHLEDHGLAEDVQAALVDLHWAAMALLTTDATDPMPWDRPRRHGAVAVIPPLATIRRHLAALDASYAELQRARRPDEADAAIVSTDMVLTSPALTYEPKPFVRDGIYVQPPRVIANTWATLAETDGCRLCGRTRQRVEHTAAAYIANPPISVTYSVSAPVTHRTCLACRDEGAAALDAEQRRAEQTTVLAEAVQSPPCLNPLGRPECDGVTHVPSRQLCRSCDQARRNALRASSAHSPAAKAWRASMTRTTTCQGCDVGITVAEGDLAICPDCREAWAA